MNGHFEYKGYVGSAEVDVEGGVLAGRLLFIRDTIAYSSQSIDGLEAAFHEAVDDYLRTCEEEGDEPDLPCKGTFNVRVGPERHRKVAIAARRADMGLNEYICFALDEAVKAASARTVVHMHEVQVTVSGEPRNMMVTTGQVPKWEDISGNAQH